MNVMLNAALAYAERGWPIIPCNSLKEPIGSLVPNGITDATTDPAIITDWFTRFPRANIGLDVGGAGMMALDFDPGSSKDATDKAVDGLPATLLRAKTPRGGDHWFYALAPGEVVAPYTASNVKGDPKFGPHVDVRSFHSYVLLAPSVTADGTYRWESEGKPAYRTDEMVRVANTAREKSKDRDEWIIKADLPENIAAAVEWLKGPAKPAIKGSGGNITAYATAAMMKSYGLSEATAFDLAWEHWAPRCTPAWYSPESLETVIEHAYEYNTSPPGNVTDAYRQAKTQALFKPVSTALFASDSSTLGAETASESTGLSGTAGRFRFADRRAMQSIEPPSWLIEDFIPEHSYVLMVAPPRSLKSFVALDIALTICAGICDNPVWTALASGNVLYMAGEGRSQLTKRVAAWEAEHYHGAEVEGFILADPIPNVTVDDDWTAFIAGAKGMSPNGYPLVILDTAGRAMQGVNENAQEHASKLTQRVEQLQRELGCAVLVIHHSGHDGARARGSSVFGADADVVVVLEREGQQMSVTIRMEKQKDAPEWERPKRVAVREIDLGGGITSLAAVAHVMKPSAAADSQEPNRRIKAQIEEARSIFSPRRWHDEEYVALVDNAVREVLSSNKIMEWTKQKLADAVAVRDDMGDVGSDAIRKTGLKALMQKPGTYTRRAFDSAKGRFKFYAE